MVLNLFQDRFNRNPGHSNFSPKAGNLVTWEEKIRILPYCSLEKCEKMAHKNGRLTRLLPLCI
jgi:hypothetical protein